MNPEGASPSFMHRGRTSRTSLLDGPAAYSYWIILARWTEPSW